MDEHVQKQLIRQLKILNFWITTFGVLLLVALGIIGFLLFQVIVFVRDTGDQLQQFRQNTTESLNLQQQACRDEGAFGTFLRNQSNLCE